MTPQAELAVGATLTGAAEEPVALAAAASPFVLNLCSSSTPMALAQTDLPELKRFTFFVSRRFEEGRERFRLHMGYFATLAEAEEWLTVVREIYPGAWAGEAPGRKLRERAAAAAAAQAQHAAGPQPRGASSPPARSAVPPPVPVHVPVLHAAAPAPARVPAPRAPAPSAMPPVAPTKPAAAKPAVARPAAAKPPARPAAPPAVPAQRATAAAPVAARPIPTAAAKSPPPAVQPAASAAANPGPARAAGKPAVFADSNVREVLAALGDASATGETRLMHAPSPPRVTSEASVDPMTDTQVLRMLETRRPDGQPTEPTVGNNIPLLKPDDTGTRAALKEAVATNAAVSFAVQLQWSVQPVELDKVPPLAIFSAYTLYTVEGSREGRKWFGLRLGFFSDAISAKQVAHYVRSEFASVAVVPVSPQEKARATDDDRRATLGAGPAPRRSEREEFKLFDDTPEVKLPVAAPVPAAKPPPKPAPATRGSAAHGRGRNAGKVGARERRGPQTLEETLEILGASQLAIDDGTRETLNDSGVRHLRVEVQQKNSPFARLLERLSDRVKKQ